MSIIGCFGLFGVNNTFNVQGVIENVCVWGGGVIEDVSITRDWAIIN